MSERNCRWFFAKYNGGKIIGPEDASVQSFKISMYGSLIRECIQNSLDACYDKHAPVRIELSFGKINKAQYGNFFDIERHIKGCIDCFNNSPQSQRIYGPIANYIKNVGASLGYIRVADFNTNGMPYDKNDINSPFIAFVQSIGNNSKTNENSGGSFGLGKAAYFAASPIKTLMVSTMSRTDDSHYFQGVTTLCDNKVDGVEYQSQGYFCVGDDNTPLSDYEQIPDEFRREEYGTDVNIMGVDLKKCDAIKNEMQFAVLRNFWYAIYSKKLIVVIDNDTIDSENLEKLLYDNFNDRATNGIYVHTSNPYPFYLAVKNAEKDGTGQYRYYEDNLPTLGHVLFFINRDKTCKSDRIEYMRAPKMLVQVKNHTPQCGLYGLFMCDGAGDDILKGTENASHTEWNRANMKDPVTDEVLPIAEKALSEMNDFINSKVNNIIDSMGTSVDVKGLDSLIEKDEIKGPEEPKTPAPDGPQPLTPPPGPKPPVDPDPGTIEHKPRGKQRLKFSSTAELVEDEWIYTIFIYSTEKVDDASFEIQIGSDNSSESIKVIPVDGMAASATQENVIEHVKLQRGYTTVKLKLSDNTMRYALKITKK